MSHVVYSKFWTGLPLMALVVLGNLVGCARLPYTTKTVYESKFVGVTLQREIAPTGYSHPAQFTADQMTMILRGFSLREQQRLPLRWFAEEQPPQRLLRDDEIMRVAAFLVDAFEKAGPDERVHFTLAAPGKNRADTKTVTDGWMAIRGSKLYMTIEHFHAEIPMRSSDNYFPNNPQMAPLPGSFLLFFEPGRFWGADRQQEVWALDYREFVKSAVITSP
jgi:hypothetical protein